MKIFILAAFIFLSANCFCQSAGGAGGIMKPLGFGSISSDYQFSVNKDTLEINKAWSINWIKINGELYQIKRVTTIEKFNPLPSIRDRNFILDTIPHPQWFLLYN